MNGRCQIIHCCFLPISTCDLAFCLSLFAQMLLLIDIVILQTFLWYSSWQHLSSSQPTTNFSWLSWAMSVVSSLLAESKLRWCLGCTRNPFCYISWDPSIHVKYLDGEPLMEIQVQVWTFLYLRSRAKSLRIGEHKSCMAVQTLHKDFRFHSFQLLDGNKGSMAKTAH